MPCHDIIGIVLPCPSARNTEISPGMSESRSRITTINDLLPKKEAASANSNKAQNSEKHRKKNLLLKVDKTNMFHQKTGLRMTRL